VGALVAVNAFGDAVTPGGREFWAGAFEIGDEFGGLGPAARRVAPGMPAAKPGGFVATNTTIAIVATDAGLDKAGARRMAEAAQDGVARAIVPAHSITDGDLVFAVATGVRAEVPPQRRAMLGHAAAVCLSRAVARAVHAATPAPDNLLPCWSQLAV
jgi:D-aminopeptidase